MPTLLALLNEQETFSIDNSNPKPADLPSQNPTRSFWADSSPDANPLAREGSTGPLITDADVCIIGSGITGIGVVYHLSEAIEKNTVQSPLKVVILEARDFCAGATGRNGGHLTPVAFSGFQTCMTRYGSEEAKRSYALEAHTTSSLLGLIEERGWTDDIDLVHNGRVDLLFSDQEVELARRDRVAAVAAGWSLDGVLDLSKEEVEASFGVHYPAVKVPGYNLWPLKLVTKLYELAKSRTGPRFDLTLHTHTPVTAIKRVSTASRPSTNATSMRAYTLSTPRGTIACSRVVHATNGYASRLLPFLSGLQGIVPVRGQVIAMRASVGADEIETNSWIALNEYPQLRKYWFPRPVKTADEKPLIILGGARNVAHPTMDVFVNDDTTCHPKVGEALRVFLPSVFEGKYEPGCEPEMEWTGIMGYTMSDDPFVGPVDRFPETRLDATQYSGQFIAAGYSGHGMPRAFGCAEVVAQMIATELVGKEWTQPEWLPTRYLTWEGRDKGM